MLFRHFLPCGLMSDTSLWRKLVVYCQPSLYELLGEAQLVIESGTRAFLLHQWTMDHWLLLISAEQVHDAGKDRRIVLSANQVGRIRVWCMLAGWCHRSQIWSRRSEGHWEEKLGCCWLCGQGRCCWRSLWALAERVGGQPSSTLFLSLRLVILMTLWTLYFDLFNVLLFLHHPREEDPFFYCSWWPLVPWRLIVWEDIDSLIVDVIFLRKAGGGWDHVHCLLRWLRTKVGCSSCWTEMAAQLSLLLCLMVTLNVLSTAWAVNWWEFSERFQARGFSLTWTVENQWGLV